MRRRDKACPIFKLQTDVTGNQIAFSAVVPGTRRVLGGLDAKREGKWLRVGVIEVDAKAQRCGLGTKLYEAAAAYACARSWRLRSDNVRTEASDGFWRKQVAKGRAVCARRALPLPHKPDVGRGGCEFYKLKSCEVAKDLSGSLRRRRRR